MEPSAEAGPSRLSPRLSSPIATTSSADIVMEDLSTSAPLDEIQPVGGEPDDAVALLLNIAASMDGPSTLPPKPESMEMIMDEQTSLTEKPITIPPDTHNYPYTPPEDSNDQTQSQTHHHDLNQDQDPSTTIPPPFASLTNPIPSTSISTSIHADTPSPSARPPTPSRTSPDPPTKPKGKRKRNTTVGSSRRASVERPPHWLGEDNTIIRCICGITEDDGFTIQCEGCGSWEHGLCFNYMDEASAPDQYFCELCKPRPFDAVKARELQHMVQDEQRRVREAAIVQGAPIAEKEKPRNKNAKSKRARLESVLIENQSENRDGGGKEESPGVMGPPPTIKPKRKQPGPKPRIKQPTMDSTPGPSSKEQVQQIQPILEEPEDEYFRVEPWALEYTPIKENIVRGIAARQTMRNVYKEWVDAEEELIAAKSRAVHNPSGLPSPTESGVLRLSPDNLFPPPDFHILAPPVPPVFLSGPDLELLASPTSIQAVEDAPSFLPLTYAENISKHGVYTRPTIYSVYAEEPITFGSFIGEFKGEVVDCESYRKDPINQYSSLGLPKPHVRSIGPPVNLMIDARGYGNDLRFVRSGCHPNAVLRPLLWRSSEHESPKLKLGLFASKDIGKRDEVVLGWEWDDQHVVHSLRSIIHAAMLSDGSLASPSFSTSSNKIINQLSDKIDSVLTHIFGTFTSCACVVPGTCALAQMGQLVEPKLMQGQNQSRENGRKKMRVDLGELVGAVRGWRRRELESAEMKKWRSSKGFDLGLIRMSSRTSEARSEDHRQDEDSSDRVGEDSMDQDVEEEDETENENSEQREAEGPIRLGNLGVAEVRMEVEEEAAPPSDPVTETELVSVPLPSAALTTQQLVEGSSPLTQTVKISTPIKTNANDIVSPILKTHTPASLSPKTPKVERQNSSSSLSSAISSVKPSLINGADSGSASGSDSESDATTATIPRSHFSESESEMTEEDEEDQAAQSSPSKRQKVNVLVAARKSRRVLSPVIESSKILNGDRERDHELSDDDRDEMVIKKPIKRKSKIIKSSPPKSISKRRNAPSKVRHIFAPTAKREDFETHFAKKNATRRIASESASESDIGADVPSDQDQKQDDKMEVDESAQGSEGEAGPTTASSKKKDIVSSPKSGKSVKLEKLDTIRLPTNSIEETRAVVPDQVTAPLSSAVEMTDASIPDPEILPPVVSQPVLETTREPTPPPKEPTPPPKEPSRPPEPPKKVSLSEYLKNHKIRKESKTPISEDAFAKADPIPTPGPSTTVKTAPAMGADTINDIPGFGNIPSSTSPVKSQIPETPTLGGRLNLLEHLPSSSKSTIVFTPATETPRQTPATPAAPTMTTTSSYAPRSVSAGLTSDYFPTQPIPTATPSTTTGLTSTSSSNPFIPRISSSYTPRQASGVSTDESGYVPRSSISEESYSNANLNIKSPIEMPPPLPMREPPPHTPTSSNTTLNPNPTTPSSAPRAPPTGPKVPPTGPRGLAGLGTPTGPPGSTAATRGFGGERGRGFGRGLWRGRGGFRGGWRGN
ncbi:uncharacterized protein IL334_002188 [Kwoniella shivajii]|uniref:SET domain-containing protein n=1 Tax=Kwoniella shivajii TaxID=564305 RepID=A0ABZ1CU12_9TREE|nr:hypothetical protein IL334_002188 [Kwoniella shivajii]